VCAHQSQRDRERARTDGSVDVVPEGSAAHGSTDAVVAVSHSIANQLVKQVPIFSDTTHEADAFDAGPGTFSGISSLPERLGLARVVLELKSV
jgi:hypothetical protein